MVRTNRAEGREEEYVCLQEAGCDLWRRMRWLEHGFVLCADAHG